jgi:MFS family permease
MAAMFVIDSFGRKKLMLVGSIGYIVSLGIVAGAFIMYAPQFSVSIANFTVQSAQKKMEQCQHAFDTASEETKDFWRAELKDALVDYVIAVEAAMEARVKGAKQQSTISDREALLELDIENLKSDIAAKIANIDLTPTVPMGGILAVLFGLMFFIASHAFGQGACIWVFISEIFPNKVRAQGQALGSFVHWILAAIVSMLFPPLLSLLGPANIFLLFAGFMILQLIWVMVLMPETKQIPLEEMQKKLGIK